MLSNEFKLFKNGQVRITQIEPKKSEEKEIDSQMFLFLDRTTWEITTSKEKEEKKHSDEKS